MYGKFSLFVIMRCNIGITGVGFPSMKRILCVFVLLARLAIAAPAQSSDDQLQGRLIDRVLGDYQRGDYTPFLQEMDAIYREKSRTGEYRGLLEERKNRATCFSQATTVNRRDVFKERVHSLVESEMRALAEICINHAEDTFSREVKDMIFFAFSPREQASLDYLHELSRKFKGDGATPLENKLINIDVEFWLKELSLDMARTQDIIDPSTCQLQHIVLQMEKLKQMQEVCGADEFGDAKTREFIQIAHALMPKVHAISITRKRLISLGRGMVEPKTQVEKEMKAIEAKHIEEGQALIQECFPGNVGSR